jgi:hypothetical protein
VVPARSSLLHFQPELRQIMGVSIFMSAALRPIPGRPETPLPGPSGPRTAYPVNDPGFADPDKPGSEPDYIPPPSPVGTPELWARVIRSSLSGRDY